MEKIEQESVKQENIKSAENLNFINTIKNDIGDTFPFLSDEEREVFLRKFDSLLEDDEDTPNTNELVKKIQQIISTLKNSHTDLKENLPKIKSNSEKGPERKRKPVESMMLSNNIGYLKILSWSNHVKVDDKNVAELVEEELNKLTESESIIIDVRENGGGNSNLAESLARHFIDKKIQFCTVLRKKSDSTELVEEAFNIEPGETYLDKKVVILTDAKCLSSNEMFILMLKDTGKAITIGQTTGGGSGNPKDFNLHLANKDFTLRVSTWRMYRNNGQPLEGVGIEPDISIAVIPDNNGNRDVVLEKAQEYLKNI
jgi:C-terminal processing protease CtpA/Prc